MYILRLLDQRELAAVRLTCQLFRKQATPLVTSLELRRLDEEMLTCLPQFPRVCSLKFHYVWLSTMSGFSMHFAPQLTRLEDLILMGNFDFSLDAFTALTRLTHLGYGERLSVNPVDAQLPSLRSLSVDSFRGGKGFHCLKACPLLSRLSICWLDRCNRNIASLTTCAHLTALRLRTRLGLSYLGMLTGLDLACLSVQAPMIASEMPAINGLSSFSRLVELHWQDPSRDTVEEASQRASVPQPQLSLDLTHLTCLVLNGPVDAMRSLVTGVTRTTSIQALGIYVHRGQAAAFSDLAQAPTIQAFRAVSAHPAQCIQAGIHPASISTAPQAWFNERSAHSWRQHCEACFNIDECLCTAAPRIQEATLR